MEFQVKYGQWTAFLWDSGHQELPLGQPWEGRSRLEAANKTRSLVFAILMGRDASCVVKVQPSGKPIYPNMTALLTEVPTCLYACTHHG